MKEKPKTSFKSSLHGTSLLVFLINVKDAAKWKVQWDRLHQVSQIRQTRKTRKRKNQSTSQRIFSIAKLLKSRRNTVMSQYLLVCFHTMRYPVTRWLLEAWSSLSSCTDYLWWLPLHTAACGTFLSILGFPNFSYLPVFTVLHFLFPLPMQIFFLWHVHSLMWPLA